MRTKNFLPALLVVLFAAGCSQKLKPIGNGPVDPAGGQAGALPPIFVKPPYRALDKVNITGQSPLTRDGKVNRQKSNYRSSK